MRPHRLVTTAILAFTLATSAPGEEPIVPASAQPTWQLSGTTLVLEPARPFERGLLRVVGPDGYRARKSFDADTPPVLDLVADGYIERYERGSHDAEAAAGAPGREPAAGDVRRSPVDLLPDGHYRFEAVFSGPAGTERFDSSILAQAGSLLGRPSGDRDSDNAAETHSSEAGSTSVTESEQLILTDNNNNGLTLVELQADNNQGSLFEIWQIQNRDGDFRIVEDGAGSQNDPRLTIVQDNSGYMGLGTTTPETHLHIFASTFDVPTIRIEDTYFAPGGYWDLTATDSTFRIYNDDGAAPFRINQGAPTNSLVLSSSAVRVNTDLTVTSSRTAKQNFLPVDRRAILDRLADLPIYEWEFREAAGVRHLGPFAEDFRSAFPLGSSETTISPTDLSGVALAAIQGLLKRLDDQDALLADRSRAIEQLAAERDALEERLAHLEGAVERLQSAE